MNMGSRRIYIINSSIPLGASLGRRTAEWSNAFGGWDAFSFQELRIHYDYAVHHGRNVTEERLA